MESRGIVNLLRRTMDRLSRGFIALAALAFALAGCGGGGGGSNGSMAPGAPSSGQSTVRISMVDAPFRMSDLTVTAVTVTIKEIQLVGTNGKQTIQSFSPSLAIDLLKYQKPPGIQLGTAAIPAGNYQQARMILDTSQPDNNSVTLSDGSVHPLKIPSATGPDGAKFGDTDIDGGNGPGTSGLKVNIGLNAVGGQTYSILLDFNAAESIHEAGKSGKWIMRPVIVGSAYPSGWFAGTVVLALPSSSPVPVVNAEILAQTGGQTINSGVTGMDGSYEINALPQGAYTIVINNSWTSQAGQAETAAPSNGVASGTCPSAYSITTGQTTVDITENPTPAPSASPSPSPSPLPPFVCSS